MPISNRWLCFSCVHLTPGALEASHPTLMTCKPFPEGIPLKYLFGYRHDKPDGDDGGIFYEKKPDAGDA